MRTLGIDLAAQDANTALCFVDWDEDGSVRVERPRVGVGDDEILAAVAAADRVGIDAPFGWPDAFAAAIGTYHGEGRWPEGAGDSRPLAYRLTDLRARELTGRWPLSVSSDRIAVPAWRCARLLSATHEGPVARHGGRSVESYPGGALSLWGLERRGYKGREGTTARAALVDGLERASGGWLRLEGTVRHECVRTDHALDALLCALIARAAALGRTHGPGPGEVDRARREGWIELPVEDSLPALAGPSSSSG